MDLIMDLDWTENSWKCWIGMRNGLGMGWTGLSQNIRTGFWTVPNYVYDLMISDTLDAVVLPQNMVIDENMSEFKLIKYQSPKILPPGVISDVDYSVSRLISPVKMLHR